jgi:hypothetical protein
LPSDEITYLVRDAIKKLLDGLLSKYNVSPNIQQQRFFKRQAMSDNFILNASPIILLGKADFLKTISPLAKSWIIPKGVVVEVEKKRSIEPFLFEIRCK